MDNPNKQMQTLLEIAAQGSRLPRAARDIRIVIALVVISALCCWAAVYSALADLDVAVNVAGRDAIPQLEAASQLAGGVARAHGNMLSAFLSGERDHGVYWSNYQADMNEGRKGVASLAAAVMVADGDALIDPKRAAENLSRKLTVYHAQFAISQYEREVGKALTASPELRAGLLHDADETARIDIEFDANFLAQTESHILEDAAKTHANQRHMKYVVAGLSAAVLLGALVWAQVLVFMRSNRWVNPGLALSSVLALATVLYGATAIGSGERQLSRALDDAYGSVDVLNQARTQLALARAAEGMALINGGNEAARQDDRTRYDEAVGKVIGADWRLAEQAAAAGHGFDGLLGSEFANITFAGERAAAQLALDRFGAFQVLDKGMFWNDRSGGLGQSVQTYLSRDGGAYDAYRSTDNALTDVLAINLREFSRAIRTAGLDLNHDGVILLATVILFTIFALAGGNARLKEYR